MNRLEFMELRKILGMIGCCAVFFCAASGVRHPSGDPEPDYAGNNTFAYNNTQSSSSTSGQIQLSSDALLIIGTATPSTTTYGHNNIISNSLGDHLIFAPSGGTVSLGGIDENYFAYGGTPTALSILGTSNATYLPNISYTTNLTTGIISAYSFSGVNCGMGFYIEGLKSKGAQPSIVVSDPILDSSDCDKMQSQMQIIAQTGSPQMKYDSAKYVIEHCAQYKLFIDIWRDFGVATGGVQDLSDDVNRWPTYREWLKKVLYLSMDSNYYCADVQEILETMRYFNADRGFDRNGSLAIIKFLIDSNRCTHFFSIDLNQLWANIRLQQSIAYHDTVRDPDHSSLDTTLPSLEDLNLQILRGPQYTAVKDAFTPSSVSKIRYLIASENPFTDETKLRFGLADAEYMKIELFDLLGNKVYSDSKLFEGGDEEWLIDGKSLARGGLYARLSTMGGQVKSVKLVHE